VQQNGEKYFLSLRKKTDIQNIRLLYMFYDPNVCNGFVPPGSRNENYICYVYDSIFQRERQLSSACFPPEMSILALR